MSRTVLSVEQLGSGSVDTTTIKDGTIAYIDLDTALQNTIAGNTISLATDSGLTLSIGVLAMGTPSSITSLSTNSVTTSTHTHTITGFQTSLSFGNLSEATSSILTITGGTGAVIGTGTTIQVIKADGSHDGYLSQGDWSVFSGKQAALSFGNVSAGSNKISIGGAPTGAVIGTGVSVDVNEGNLTISNMGGTLSIGNGGTGQGTAANAFNALSPLTTLGDIIYGNGSNTATRLGGNITGTSKYLKSVGDGVNAAAPSWVKLSTTDFSGEGTTIQVLHGNAGGPPSWASVTESDMSFTISSTTNNATITTHGLLPILSGGTTQFLRGDGTWTTPSGTASAYLAQSFSSQTSVTCTHNFGAYPLVNIIDESGNVLIPQTINHSSINAFTVTFDVSSSGNVLATLGSPQVNNLVTVSGDYTTLSSDYIIIETGSNHTLTLLSAIGINAHINIIKNASTGLLTVNTSLGQTIDNNASITLNSLDSITVISNNVNYYII